MTANQTPVWGAGAIAPDRIAPGDVLDGKYRVDRVLADGGMGYVLAATHLHLQERVALKLLLPEITANREVVLRFVREAQAAARLKGEHVARVIDVGTLATGAPYMVMEYLDGADLAALLADRGPLPVAEVTDILLPVCEALAEAHARGIVHRDIKPGNVFLARRPDGSRLVKVLDFGISKALNAGGAALTRSLTAMGTPAYMSPEQLRSARDVDGRTDIWSLGVVLHECVIGRRPFEADSVPGLCLAVAEGVLAPLPGWLPPRIAEIIRRCLARDPARRWSSMGELAAALAPHAGDQGAARVVVERTRALERGVATLEPGRIPGVRGAPTTLGASTVVVGGTARQRSVAVGAVAAVAGFALAAWFAFGRGERTVSTPVATSSAAPVRERPATPPSAPSSTPAEPTPHPPTPAAPTSPAPVTPPTPVTIHIDSSPAGATVSRATDGVELGVTPFDIELARSAGLARFRLTLADHVAEAVTIDLAAAGPTVHRKVTLRPARSPTPSSPAPPAAPALRGRGQPVSPGDL